MASRTRKGKDAPFEMTKKRKAIIRNCKNAKFYFISDKENLPRGTVCIMKEGDKFARGIALCSISTKFPDSEEGCFHAWACAKRAMNVGGDDHLITRPEAFEVIKSLKSISCWNDAWEYRCQFDVLPDNGVEKKIFKCLEE